MGKLTARQVQATTAPGRYGDGDGLWLHVGRAGAKSWVLRYKLPGAGMTTPREMGLGPVSLVTLAEAREKARRARRLALDGTDPLAQRDAERAEARAEKAKAVTFRDAADRYVAAHEAGWRNAKHRQQWRNTLATYAFPVFGDLSVADVSTDLVMRVLEPIWTTKAETANRVRGRIENVLDWAKVRGLREGENPARWRGHLDALLPARAKVQSVKHHSALPYAELPAFMDALYGQAGVAARALEFCILTATRTGEALGAPWSEIDLDAAVWTIPAERMKASKPHRVPLSDRALAILAEMRALGGEADGYVFPGAKRGKPLSNMAMTMVLRRMERGHLTVHGFRSCFADWAAERTNAPHEVREMALAHTISSGVERAYRRGDLFEKRRELMGRWAGFAGGSDADVVRIAG